LDCPKLWFKKNLVRGQSKMPITKEKIELWVGSTIQFSPRYFFALERTFLRIWFSYFLKTHIIRESPCQLVPKKKQILKQSLAISWMLPCGGNSGRVRNEYELLTQLREPDHPLVGHYHRRWLLHPRLSMAVWPIGWMGALLGPPCPYRGQGLSRISFVTVPSRVTFNNSMPRGGSWIVSDGHHHCFYGAPAPLSAMLPMLDSWSGTTKGVNVFLITGGVKALNR
jgi:hypothetical protein